MSEITTKLDQLADLKKMAEEARIDYEKKRTEILKSVQTELDALDAEFTPLLQTTEERIEQLDSEIRELVLKFGASVRGKSVQALFFHGRVSWDNKGLNAYAQSHPEVTAFRRVGQPIVQLRTIKPSQTRDME